MVGIAALLLALLLVCGASFSPNEAKEPRFLLAWGQKGDKEGEFYSPIHIVIDGDDVVYVADLNNARAQRFTTEGKYVGGFNVPLDSPPRKSCMIGGMAVDDAGLVYLSFMIQHRVGVYTRTGELVREWGKKGTGDGEFNMPGGIVLHQDGTVYVTDQCNHRIQQFTAEGKFLGKWGGYGSEPGQFGGPEPAGSRFGGPHFLAQDSKGCLYTTEGVFGRVQQFSSEGKPLRAWGDKTDNPGGFGALPTGYSKQSFGPTGVYVDRFDRVWVSSLNDRVSLFTTDGKYVLHIGGAGKEPGQFARPHGMAVDSKGNLYVADAGNQRVQKFEVPDGL